MSMTPATTMRAVRYDRYGSAEVLHVSEVPVPPATPGLVQVRVAAASPGAGELPIIAGHLRRFVRTGFPAGVGVEFTGTVSATGDGVDDLATGDPVWGMVPHGTFGAIAEYVSVPRARLASPPSNLDLVEAASLPAAGTTAMTALRTTARVRPGERVLVRGASGGVGTTVVQLAKSMGADVTGLASAPSLGAVLRAGADRALDHRSTPAGALGRFDVIVDLVGTGLPEHLRLLGEGGRFVPLAVDPLHPIRATALVLWQGLLTRGRVRTFSNDPSQAQLTELAALVEAGTLRPAVDRVYPLHATPEAFARLASGGVQGKLVVDMTLDRPAR